MSADMEQVRYRAGLGAPRHSWEHCLQWLWRWRLELMVMYLVGAITAAILYEVLFA